MRLNQAEPSPSLPIPNMQARPAFSLRALLAVALLAGSAVAASAPRSNMVLLLLDDVGYGDVDFGGGTHLSPAMIPNIAELARGPNTVVLRRFYSGAAICAPTRSSMLTGRTPTRECVIRVESNPLPRVLNTSTTAAYAQQAGYATGFFGKWHLGSLTSALTPDCQPRTGSCLPGYIGEQNNTLCCDGRDFFVPVLRPVDVGFETALATPQVAPSATANCGCVGTVPGAGTGCELGHYVGRHVLPKSDFLECQQYFRSTDDGDMVSVQEVTPVDDAEYLVDNFERFAEQAVQQGKPFFAQIAFHQCHIPYIAPPRFRMLYPEFDENHQDYYGSLSAVDVQVGRIRSLLQRLGVANNTFLALTSDNGPENSIAEQSVAPFKNPGSTGGLTGRKRTLAEGGIRVPGIIEYPPLVRANRVEPGYFPAVTSDFLPTLLDITGMRPTHADWPVDGTSLLPLLAGTALNRTTPIGWLAPDNWVTLPPEAHPFRTCPDRPVNPPPAAMPVNFRLPFLQFQFAWTEGVHKLFACNAGVANATIWRFALYDVVEDPAELRDLWPTLGATLGEAMFTRFLAWTESVRNSIATETRCVLHPTAAPSRARNGGL